MLAIAVTGVVGRAASRRVAPVLLISEECYVEEPARVPRSKRLEPDLDLTKDGWQCEIFALPTRDGQWAGYVNLISLIAGTRVERLVVAEEHPTHALFIAAAQKAALGRVRTLCELDARTTSITGSG